MVTRPRLAPGKYYSRPACSCSQILLRLQRALPSSQFILSRMAVEAASRNVGRFLSNHHVSLNWISVLLLITSSTWIIFQASSFHSDDTRCIRATASWSPALDIVKYHWKMYDEAAKWDTRNEFLGNHKPSLEVEAAWHSIIPGLPPPHTSLVLCQPANLNRQHDPDT